MKCSYKIKVLLVTLGALVMMGAGCRTNNTQTPTATSTMDNGIESARETTVKGNWVCLPHQVTGDGVETMECAFGIKADDGKHYALDFSRATLPADLLASIQTNDRVSIFGLLVPIEQISNNVWDKYDVRGVIEVMSLEKE